MGAQAQNGNRLRGEGGIALITTILVMMLMSALLVGFTTVVMSDQRYRTIDRDRVRAFYAAHSGLEKLNLELRNLFLGNVAPTTAQIAVLADSPPVIPDVTFVSTGDSAYGAKFEESLAPRQIATGPYAGLMALKKVYRLHSTARTVGGGESHLTREVETVAIPVFQFGMFSEVDLSFSAADEFDFGGRVHTNGNLFLAQGGGTLWLREKVTAVREVVRQRLSNGASIDDSGSTGPVKMATAANAFRTLARTEGSISQGPGTALNGSWPTISVSTYNGYIRNGLTGARSLNLPLITTGGANIDLIKRPAVNENLTNSTLLSSRYFNNVSLRILLSDTAANITTLPTVTSTAPVALDGNWRTAPPAGYTVSASRPPVARSPGRPLELTTASLPTVNGSVSSGTGRTITVSPAVPIAFKVQTAAPAYYALTVTKGTNTYYVTCTAKTTSTFTGCRPDTAPGASVTTSSGGAVVKAVLTNDQIKSTPLTASWSSSWGTITVGSGNTAAFTPNTFTLTVVKASNTYTVHCSAKTLITFTGCIPVTAPTASVAATSGSPVTVSATVMTTPDGFEAVSTNVPTGTSNQWASPWSTITVNSTLPFALDSFWVHNGNDTNVLVTCGGYAAPDDLTGCNVDSSLQDNATITSGALTDAGIGTLGGVIKIEMQDTSKVWRDVTAEILAFGFAGTNLAGKACGEPNPNAIIKLQRLRDNDETSTWWPTTASTCSYSASQRTSDYWPNVLFDAREAVFRDDSPGAHPLLGGVMHYVSIDVANLSAWFAGTGAYSGGSGNSALSNSGYSVYFSDRRNNRNASGLETGEYGFEDVVNPLSSSGTPNGTLQTGEDFNGNGTVEVYGQLPSYNGAANAVPTGGLAPLTAALARPTVEIRASAAMVNRSVLYRRALKLVNGGVISTGLTIAAENPVYIQGNYNFNAAAFANPNPSTNHAATSVVADAVTLLSNAWVDINSLTSPYTVSGRDRSSETYYRTAIIAGKGVIFPKPSSGSATFGTDGGAHSFLRFLEGGSGTIYYRGSLATFYYNRQAVAPFKCCGGVVYSVPERQYAFDIDFLDPAKLPPLTPVFRDVNSLGFTQETRPGR